jgi:glycerol-3-phosphate O-acyltransferase
MESAGPAGAHEAVVNGAVKSGGPAGRFAPPGAGGDVDVEAICREPSFERAVGELAAQLGRGEEEVRAEAAAGLREMAASHDPRAQAAWNALGQWLLRGFEVVADEEALARLRELDRAHSLVWLPSHRSYLDAWALPLAAEGRRFSAMYTLGGINLDFWPFGTLARRTGLVFIRRSVREDPVYRLALRQYLAALVRDRANLGWSIEGGRSRTGKLRPPRYGVLHYLTDAVVAEEAEQVLLVPVSIVYDHLAEVAAMTAEAQGAKKRPEGVAWLVRFAGQQGKRGGKLYLDFGEPIPLLERVRALSGEPDGSSHVVERVALAVCHEINRATPIIPRAVVTLALLGADRALTLREVHEALDPMVRYVARRGYPVAGDVVLDDPALVSRTLQDLVDDEVVTRFDGGRETVWSIKPERQLVAAFYRNTAIHFLVNRAIAELVVQRIIAREPDDVLEALGEEALRLRELLKFEFFFARKRDYLEEMRAEMALLDERWEEHARAAEPDARRGTARDWLEGARPHLAHLVLRPFVEAYLVVGECLAAHRPAEELEEERFLEECLGVARQWRMQRRLESEESVSLELLRTGLRLARHRELFAAGDEALASRRAAFAAELRGTVREIGAIADMARRSEGASAA